MRTVVRAAIAFAATMLANASAQAATVKLATWNMHNLHHVVGEPLRSGAPARTEADYELLRKYRDRLNADVIALQEVNGPKAAALVFPADRYDLYFSARYIDDLVTGRATHLDPEQRSDRIYTGFAIRRGVFDAVSKRDVPSLRSSVDVPTVIILIGVIGGLLAYGLIGVFLGPVIIALGYELFRAWVRGEQTVLRQTTA
jgi:hypothetical protein